MSRANIDHLNQKMPTTQIHKKIPKKCFHFLLQPLDELREERSKESEKNPFYVDTVYSQKVFVFNFMTTGEKEAERKPLAFY